MQGYPRGLPATPSLRTGAKKTAAVRRATTVFDLPTTVESSLPYLAPRPPPVVRSSSETVAAKSSRDVSRKDRRYGYDFEHELSLAHKQPLDEVPADGRRNSFLPSIHGQESEDIRMDWSANRTPSSTYSSSLYTTEFDFEFPQPPLSPDLGAYKDCPMFTEEETSQVKNFLRNRWGTIDVIEQTAPTAAPRNTARNLPPSVPGPFPISIVGDETGDDPSWTEYWDGKRLGDFSWECDDSGESDNKDEGTHNILGQMGLLNDVDDDSRNFSLGQSNKVSRIPVRRSEFVKEDLGDVSVVLSALRSSINLDYSGDRVKGLDDDADDDKELWDEMRMRLRARSWLSASCKRENSVIQVSSPTMVASKSSQARNISSNDIALPSPRTSSRKLSRTLHTSQSSRDFGEARIAQRYKLRARNTADSGGLGPSAFERLETSVSKLHTHSPHQPPRFESQLPTVPPKDKLNPLPSSKKNLNRNSGILKRTPVGAALPLASEPQIGSHQSKGQAVPKNLGDRHFHARSPSAPASVVGPTQKSHLAPAFSVRRPYASHDESLERSIPRPASPKKSNIEGYRSFMDITPEQKPRRTHNRSRTSIAGAVFNAEKARKLLARASSSIASWGKGLARSNSKKD
jgi:hypothetical protein